MDLKNLTPKDKMFYEIAIETKGFLMNDLKQNVIPKNYEEIIYMISRAEYKRGKADGFALEKEGEQ